MATQTLERNKNSKAIDNANKADLEDGQRIDDIAQFWLDNGIIFQLNRFFFHPIGYSVSVDWLDADDHSQGMKLLFHNYTKNPTQTFGPETFNAGRKKWNTFWKTKCIATNEVRRKKLGFVLQKHADYREDQTHNKV